MRALCFLLVTVCQAEREDGSLLQLKSSEIVTTLQGLRSSCLGGLRECLPQAEIYRSLIWSKVEALEGPSDWLPNMTWQSSYSIFNTLDDAMAFMSCSDGSDDLVLFYRHIWKAAGHSIFENLERAGRIHGAAGSSNLSFKVIGSMEFCGNFDPRNSRHFAFTFVRDPISRFLAGYSEIEKRVREQRPGFESLIKTLEQYPAGSVLSATAFFQEFLKNGINGDGHVKPQVEYLGQSQGCSIPMRFVGRVENITIDWPRMFHDAHCDQRNFDTALGLHPNDPRDRSSMEALIRNPSEEYGPFALASTDEVTSAATSLQKREVASMQEVLTKSSALHLRTLCWIYLPDFAVFRYEPPLSLIHI